MLLDFGLLVTLLRVLGWKPFRASNWVILVALERFHFLFYKASSLKRIGPWNKELRAPEVSHFTIFCPRRWFFFQFCQIDFHQSGDALWMPFVLECKGKCHLQESTCFLAQWICLEKLQPWLLPKYVKKTLNRSWMSLEVSWCFHDI